jgi:hypothetical protein
MSYCPNCRTEYRPGFSTCSDCGSRLVPRLPENGTKEPGPAKGHLIDDDMVPVYDPPDPMMCLSIAALLDENGISCALKSGSDHVWLYDGTASAMRHRSGKVMVLEGDRERAEELINDYLSAPVPEDPEASVVPGQTVETAETEGNGEEK